MATTSDFTPRLFTDNDITGQILSVIANAKTHLAIVSPYIDRVPRVEQAIQAIGRNVQIVLLTRSLAAPVTVSYSCQASVCPIQDTRKGDRILYTRLCCYSR